MRNKLYRVTCRATSIAFKTARNIAPCVRSFTGLVAIGSVHLNSPFKSMRSYKGDLDFPLNLWIEMSVCYVIQLSRPDTRVMLCRAITSCLILHTSGLSKLQATIDFL